MRTKLVSGLILFLFFGGSFFGRAQEQENFRRVILWADGQLYRFETGAENAPALLAEAGFQLQEGDQLLYNGTPIAPQSRLPANAPIIVQLKRAFSVRLNGGGISFPSTASSLGQALWEAGHRLRVRDHLDPAPETFLGSDLEAAWTPAEPVTFLSGSETVRSWSAKPSVGAALLEAGLALQGLDYSLPAPDQPIPSDRRVEIIRVQEDILLEQESIPFGTLFQPAPEVEIDQQQVLQVGEFGLQARRVRVLFENGAEISRTVDAEWTAAAPKARIIGYGTNIVVRTISTPQGDLEYWRAVPAYATSYSPCRLGTGSCGNTTASGLQLEKGLVAVIRSWYNAMVFSQVYVEGYGIGTIADIGAGVAGQNWIDLGYEDDDWVSWSRNVTIYFLTPIPAPEDILWILP